MVPCGTARDLKEDAWNRWRRSKRINLWNKFKQARNKIVTTLREELKNFERDVVNRCKDQPKLFFKYVNSKMKARKSIDKKKSR